MIIIRDVIQMRQKQRAAIHTNVLLITNRCIEKLMPRLYMNKSEVIDNAAEEFDRANIPENVINETLLELADNCDSIKEAIHPSLLNKTLRSINENARKYRINKGDVIDVMIAYYEKICNGKLQEMTSKKVIKPMRENFVLQSIRSKILYTLYVEFPNCIKRSELTESSRKIELQNDKIDETDEDYIAELKRCVKSEYVHILGSGYQARYMITEKGISHLIKTSSMDVRSFIERYAPFIDVEWLMREAERVLREKEHSTLDNTLTFYCDTIQTMIKREYVKKGKTVPKDHQMDHVPIKILKALCENNPIKTNGDTPLSTDEKYLLRKKILQYERNNLRRRLYPNGKIVLSLLKKKGKEILRNDVKTEAGLHNFYKDVDDILEQLEKENKISTYREGKRIVKISINNRNIRTILGNEEKPGTIHKLLMLAERIQQGTVK